MNARPSDAARSSLLRAIRIESRNSVIYDSLAQLFSGYDESVTAAFSELAEEERLHGAELERRYRDRFGPLPSATEEPKEVIEAPDLEDPEALIFDSMTIDQALQAGLRAEEAAREFYQEEVTRVADPELQTMYRELAEFEEGHVRLLKERLVGKRGTGDLAPRW